MANLPTRVDAPLDADSFSAAVTAVTSAFGDPTRRAIYLFVRDRDGGATTAEVAEKFALHPNVARHHLEKLAAGGYAEVRVTKPEHAGAGRPSKRYVVESELDMRFPIRRDELLVTLLARMLAVVPPADAERVAEEVGTEYGRTLASHMAPGDGNHRSFQAALHAVADALTAHGFAAHTESAGGALRIVSEQCPFGEAAIAHPVICAVDRGMVKGMLGALYGDTAPATAASRAQGDAHCITTLA